MANVELEDIMTVIKERFLKSATDIFESLELLKETIRDTMDEMMAIGLIDAVYKALGVG